MAKKKRKDEDLFDRLRALGMRKGRARKVSESLHNGSRKAPKAARRAIADLTGAAAEVQDRISQGPQKRKKAAEKAARTQAKNARKRSSSAKKAARTRAKASH
jgi:translation initiation factor 2B subunit (eIF-2B alpha/beta/delta family)